MITIFATCLGHRHAYETINFAIADEARHTYVPYVRMSLVSMGPPTHPARSEVIHVLKRGKRWPVSWARGPDSDRRSIMEPKGR